MNIIKDENIIAALYAAYEGEIKKLSRNPLTGAKFSQPKDSAGRAQALNIFLYNPEVVFVWTKTMTYAHAAIWAPYMNGSSRKFAVIAPTRKGRPIDNLGLLNTPSYMADEGYSRERHLPLATNCSVILYPTNFVDNSKYLTSNPTLIHVHVNHGDSDKSTNASRLAALYDFVAVADTNAIERFYRAGIELPQEKFLLLGGSVIPGIVRTERETSLHKVLYAPTFEGWSESGNFSSLIRAKDAIMNFAREGTPHEMVLRPHHSMGDRSAKYKEQVKLIRAALKTRGAAEGSDVSTKVGQFNWCDVIVADISGVLSEFLFTSKPIIVPISEGDGWLVSHAKKAGLSKYCYLWDYEKISLADFLKSIADDPLKRKRESRRKELYQDCSDFAGSLALFDEALDYLTLHHSQRARRTQRVKASHDAALPSDRALADIVQSIKRGEAMLQGTADASAENMDPASEAES